MLSKICSSGLENFFVLSTEGGELQRVTEEWLPSLSMSVFEGAFSCCQQGHKCGVCDKESLVEPVLGLYSLVLRQVQSASGDRASRHMEQVLRHILVHAAFLPEVVHLRSVEPGRQQDHRGARALRAIGGSSGAAHRQGQHSPWGQPRLRAQHAQQGLLGVLRSLLDARSLCPCHEGA